MCKKLRRTALSVCTLILFSLPLFPSSVLAAEEVFEASSQTCLAIASEQPAGMHYDADEHPEFAPKSAKLEWGKNWHGVMIINHSDVPIKHVVCGSFSVAHFNDAELLQTSTIEPGGWQYIHYYDPSGTCKNAFAVQGRKSGVLFEETMVNVTGCQYLNWTIENMKIKPTDDT